MTGSLSRQILLPTLCLILLGCTSSDTFRPSASKDQSTKATSEMFRGNIVFGHEVRSFRPCGSNETIWVQDRSGLLWDLHKELAPQTEPYEEVFFILQGRRGSPPAEGFGADYSAQLEVEEILYAAQEGFSCETKWAEFSFRAYGNEPFWSAEVSEQGLQLKRLGESDFSWDSFKEKRVEERVVYTAEQVTLELAPEPCRDSMSGAFFGYGATLRFRQEELSGCALKGEDASY